MRIVWFGLLLLAACSGSHKPSRANSSQAADSIPPAAADSVRHAAADSMPYAAVDSMPHGAADTISSATRLTRRVTPYGATDGATRADPFEPDSFAFVWFGDSVMVGPGGRGVRRSKAGTTTFQVPVDTNGSAIVTLAVASVGRDLLLLYEQQDAESGTSAATRLDSATLRPVWFTSLVGFNLGTGLLDSTSLYAASISVVGRIDLATGRFVWRRDDTFETLRCDAYDYPRLVADTVIFMCSGTRPDRFHRLDGRSLNAASK